jgi:NitT/TauT family transport system ATP-binding protein
MTQVPLTDSLANGEPAAPLDLSSRRTAATDMVSNQSPTFEVVDLSVEFATKKSARLVLDKLNFEVNRGEFVSLVGASGTGKTTILRALGGLQEVGPESRILFDGKPVTEPPEGVVLVFQDYFSSLLPWRTVRKNVLLGIERRFTRAECDERIASALSLVGLADRAGDYPSQLSGGMQQRVQIARALAMEPAVLLMDEPFGALDALTKGQLQDELLRVHALKEMTIIFVTHDIEEAVYLSDRVLVLDGPPARLSQELDIELPRPRHQLATKELPQYLKYRHGLYQAISGNHEI